MSHILVLLDWNSSFVFRNGIEIAYLPVAYKGMPREQLIVVCGKHIRLPEPEMSTYNIKHKNQIRIRA